jgi:hypothetical protein
MAWEETGLLPDDIPEEPPTDACVSRWETFPDIQLKQPQRTAEIVARLRDRVDYFVTEEELATLVELAGGSHGGPDEGYIVEFGTLRGGTACALALGSEWVGYSLPIIAVDMYGWRDVDVPERDRFMEYLPELVAARTNFIRMDLMDRICSIVTPTDRFAPFWRRPIRFLFHDPSHTWYQTIRELLWVSHWMLPGSFVAAHDYGPSDAINKGVAPAWNLWLDLAGEAVSSTWRSGESMVVAQFTTDEAALDGFRERIRPPARPFTATR